CARVWWKFGFDYW
nr:immunoglobulin heavy chain junction region [Macaca mulatta]